MADKVVNYIALGKKIRQKRLSIGLSQDAVSEIVGLSESFYGHIERGDRILSVESLVRIADYLELSLDFLLMESKSKSVGKDERLQTEHLLSIFKVLAENVEKFKL